MSRVKYNINTFIEIDGVVYGIDDLVEISYDLTNNIGGENKTIVGSILDIDSNRILLFNTKFHVQQLEIRNGMITGIRKLENFEC